MTIKYSDAVRNAGLDARETQIGTGPILRIYSGSVPANVAASLGGATLLAQGTLPSDWLGAASGGVKSKAGSWTLTGQSGAGGGTDGTFFRIYASDGTTPHVQGTFGDAGTEDMVADNASIANGQTVTINSFAITAGNP